MWPQDLSSLTRRQQSAFYLSGFDGERDLVLRNRPNYHFHFYTHMLVEDIGLHTLPLAWQKDHPAQLQPYNARFADIIAFALTARHYYGPDLTTAVYDFVSTVTTSLASYSEYVFELVELCDPDTGEVKAIDLCFIQPMTLFQRKGEWIQYVPEGVAAELKVDQYIKLDPARLLFFRLPERLRDNWMNMMRSLAEVSEVGPRFEFSGLDTSTNRVPFDFNEHHRLREQVIARLTREVGWNMRMYPHDGMLEYYWLHRFLQFERFKIEMRDSVLATLNEGLRRIGRALGMHGQIEIPGLPTLQDVHQAQRDLQSGRRPAGDILGQFRAY